MKRLYVIILALICFSTICCSAHPSTFAQKDIFQSNYFIKNVPGLVSDFKGQPIRYFADHEGICVYLTDAGPIYKLVDKDEEKIKEIEREKKHELKKGKHIIEEEERELPVRISYVPVKWIGANPHPRIESIHKSTGYYTYLAGTVLEGFHSIITDGYSKLIYHDLYPGIDVEYILADRGGMKYDLIIHPGADLSRIQMKYSGDAQKIGLDQNGNLIIHTSTGDITEHAPVSYTNDGKGVASSYTIKGNAVNFELAGTYDHSKTVIVDPWVTVLTQLTVRNLGVSIDYDLIGNAYVYGAGAQNYNDAVNFHKVAKFDLNGNFLWVFMGSVPSVGWDTRGSGSNDLSNAKVDRVTNKIYVGNAFNSVAGTRLIRLTSTGVYDNFVSIANVQFEEIWSFVSDCSTGSVLALGGGLSSNLNMGVIDPVSGVVTTSNFTTVPNSIGQDIVSGAYDAFGNLYTIMASGGTPSINNKVFKVNSAYNGYVWQVPCGYSVFSEGYGLPAFNNSPGFNTNNYNALAANGSYLYYYDGHNVKAFNLSTGAGVGTPAVISNYIPQRQGGIAVDDCNNIYVGGKGVIKTFTFNGSTFSPGADISLGAAFAGDSINDVRYNASNNLLYATGQGVVATCIASLSTGCTVVNTFSNALTYDCQRATVQVVPGPGLSNPVFSYIWEDSSGNIVRQTSPGIALVDTLANLNPGRYSLQIQLNVNCGGAIKYDSFTVICNNLTVSADTTICTGGNARITATGLPPGGSYLWSPGGATTSSITVSPATSTTYTVIYTPPSGSPVSDSVRVTVVSTATVVVADTAVCSGQSVRLTATPSVGGGTYLWSPGGATTQTISVSPLTTSTYTVTYSAGSCGVAVDSGKVSVTPRPDVVVSDTIVCAGQSATLTATPSIGGGTYVWSPGGATTASITEAPAGASTYTVIYTIPGCIPDTASGTIGIITSPVVSLRPDTTICPGTNAILFASVSATGGSYQWSPGGSTTPNITVSPASATTYTVAYSLQGCASVSATETINIYPSVSVSITPRDPECYGVSDGIIVSSIQPPGSYQYLWNNGAITANDSSLTAGIYRLTVTDAHGCNWTDSAVIHSPPPATLDILPSDTTVLQGNSVQLISAFGGYPGSSIVSYTWTPSVGLSCGDCAAPLATTGPNSDSINIYTLTVIYNNGCIVQAVDTLRMEYLAVAAIPNAFTPNGDGKNDTYRILAKGVIDFKLSIYNRWGQLIFVSTDINIGWDGTYKGLPQPDGEYSYFFNIGYQNGKKENHSGAITLLR